MSFFVDIDDFIAYVPVSRELDSGFTKIPTQASIAEKQYISGEIGKVQLEEFRQLYADNAENTYQQTARKMLQKALANFTMALFIPKHKVQIDSQGLRVTEDNDRKDAKPHDTQKAIEAFERDGWYALEELLEYLESKEDDFPQWSASKEATRFKRATIRTCVDLENATGLRVSRRLFKKINPHIDRHQKTTVAAITSKELLEEIIDQIDQDTLTPENEAILSDIQYIVANGALRDALAMLPVEFSDEGITVAGNSSNSNTVKVRTAASDAQLNETKNQLNLIFEQHKGFLSRYLHENHATYPLFESSSAYTPTRTGDGFKNSDDSKVFMM